MTMLPQMWRTSRRTGCLTKVTNMKFVFHFFLMSEYIRPMLLDLKCVPDFNVIYVVIAGVYFP